ncbi:hypothetical protein [Tunturibacter empetritectus]|uniref:Uncharacterized protein n=1 Tax=Tunturiibacter empetritectus TaxID=3069691 RepID=A0A7W8MR02_9BACT|nr:hypothetical protein [Edaphobacter lichenicola]MBB5317306.1 hypothetical protein [Edaphobacter lichenicola]
MLKRCRMFEAELLVDGTMIGVRSRIAEVGRSAKGYLVRGVDDGESAAIERRGWFAGKG